MRTSRRQPYNPVPYQGKLTIANAITDVTRLAGVEGDGAAYPDSSVGVWPAATNLITNGGFETNTTGWVATGTNTIAVSAEQAKFGSKSLKTTWNAADHMGAYAITFSGATAHTLSLWMYVPTAYDGSPVAALLEGFTSMTGTASAVADLGIRDAWQRVSVGPFTPDVGSLSGFIVLRGDISTAPTAGRFFYVDGVQCETGSIATPYIETDGGTASRSLGRIRGTASVLDETQGWVVFRGLMGFGNSAEPSSFPALFEWADDASNRLLLYYEASSNGWKAERKAAAAGATVSQSLAVNIGDAVTVAMTWTASALAVESNGAAFTTTANSSIPTLAASTFDIGSMPVAVANNPFSGDILWVAAGAGELTAADAALMHAWGNNDPLPHMFPRSAHLTFLAHFNGDGTFYRRAA